jgi:site-specific recombinase XerD
VKFGAYYFVAAEPMRVPKTNEYKKWVRLCSLDDGESVMLAKLSELLGNKVLVEGSMPHLCAEFKEHKLGKYTKETQDQYKQYLDVIADEFEDFHVGQVTTKEFADFLSERYRGKANTAQKVAALARKLFKYAISRLGLREDNPIEQLDLSDFETERRTVLPTHDQVQRIRAAGMFSKPRADNGLTLPTQSGPMFACLVDMAYLLWARALDIRTLKESQIEGGHIRIQPSKTRKSSGKVVDITITPAIQDVINRARAIKKGYEVISPYLFPTQKGQPYTKSGLNTMWVRARDRAGITDPVWFKDLRALGATDAARAGKQMHDIQKRLVHTTAKTSEIYIKEAIPDISAIDMSLPWKSS